jgi:hypothetical protein
MLGMQSPSERARVTPTVIDVVPTICQPPSGDIEAGGEGIYANTPVAVADAVPTSWTAVNSTVVPDPVREPLPAEQTAENFERERILLRLYQTSRFIRVVSVLDCAFVIVFGLFQPIFFILLPFPICGYWGAKKWIYRLLYAYTIYLVIEILGGVISMVYIHTPAFLVIRCLYVLMNIIIVRYTTNLASYILVFQEEDFDFLKNSPMIKNVEKSLLC